MNSENNNWFNPTNQQAIFAFMMISAVIVGFFTGIVESSTFVGLAMTVITFYFKKHETDQMQKQLDKKDVEIQALNVK